MKRVLTGLALVVMVGCGAAGEPLQPSANVGVSIGSNGITPSASAGLRSGPVSLNLDL